tara:strand:+ start:1033 stop:1143 length:111 start_codon:yes stop_codon:yes gene_type:complete
METLDYVENNKARSTLRGEDIRKAILKHRIMGVVGG